jgi:hypothetical protein
MWNNKTEGGMIKQSMASIKASVSSNTRISSKSYYKGLNICK